MLGRERMSGLGFALGGEAALRASAPAALGGALGEALDGKALAARLDYELSGGALVSSPSAL